MTSSDARFLGGAALALLLLAAVLFGSAFFAARLQCHRSLDARDLDGRYEFIGQGCLVETDDGTVVPLDDYRWGPATGGEGAP